MASRETVRHIWAQIDMNRISSASGHFFVTPTSLKAILTEAAVNKAVAELDCEPEDRLDLGTSILNRGLITFAILVWMHQEDAITVFRRHGALDSRLPLLEAEAQRIVPQFGSAFSREYQWPFIPHKFERNEYREIEPARILPFMLGEGVPVTGGFGTVTEVRIHHDLQDFNADADKPFFVVRKTLRHLRSRERYDGFFKNEKACLRLLNCLNHPNIVPVLSSFTQSQQHNFVFPRLDMNLAELFAKDKRHGNFIWDFTFFSSLHGLASGLSNVHNVRLNAATNGIDFDAIGYHHDIRPANILVNKETFVLADFGLGRLKPAEEPSTTNWKAGAGDYLAPECMNENFDHQNVGRSIDIWAFGCLMAEVATFIRMGSDGLRRFCDARTSVGPQSNWETSYFFDANNSLKPQVKQWLGFLTEDGPLRTVTMPLYSIILSALTGPSHQRPRIECLCQHLAFLSLKAHFHGVCDALCLAIETRDNQEGSGDSITTMKLWFERERFKAFGTVMGFDEVKTSLTVPTQIERQHDEVINLMLNLFRILSPNTSASGLYTEHGVSKSGLDHSNSKNILPDSFLETEIVSLIDELWALLPNSELRGVTNTWVRAMLDTDNTDRLGNLEASLGQQRRSLYQEAASMAAMARIRLEIQANPSSGNEDLKLGANEVEETGHFSGHCVGTYQANTPVLIEWMYYTPAWDIIPITERAVIMAYKAKGFGISPKPNGLRLLDCIGFFEQSKDRPGYGFVYRLPQSELPDMNASPTTLLKLLMQSAKQSKINQHLNQPLLFHKYQLASKLAEALMEFHTVGWLHETLHSNNVIFPCSPPDEKGINPDRSSILKSPYIVGTHKSRPGSDSWHTEGPAPDSDFHIYQHPDYETKRRYRLEYDYYSLALVLLEIGLWTPLVAWAKKPEYRNFSPHKLRDVIVDVYVPRLGPRMGEIYRDVVNMCLSDNLVQDISGEGNKERDNRAFHAFNNSVVGPLMRLAEASL